VRMLFPGLKGSLGFLVRFFFKKFRFLPEKIGDFMEKM
jgi:hypothetical protein